MDDLIFLTGNSLAVNFHQEYVNYLYTAEYFILENQFSDRVRSQILHLIPNYF